MSSVRVLFFASLREAVGVDGLTVQASSIAELLKALGVELGAEKVALLTAENVRIAVNQTLLSGERALAEGDEVAFLPPVTGG